MRASARMRQRTRSSCRNTHPGRITIATCPAISSAIAPTGQPGSSIATQIGAALWIKSAGPIVIGAGCLRANGLITVQLGPDQIVAMLSLEFADTMLAPDIEEV